MLDAALACPMPVMTLHTPSGNPTSESNAGKFVYSVHPNLRKRTNLKFTAAAEPKAMRGPSAVKGVMPSAETPNQQMWANWLQGDVGLYLPSDQALPQEVVAAYFEAQDSVLLGAMTPADAAKQIQEAVVAWKKRNS